jgi:hypothetical protein
MEGAIRMISMRHDYPILEFLTDPLGQVSIEIEMECS